MDGNGRWAKKQGKKGFGHIRGAETVSEIVEEVARKNKFSYPFAFSVENLSRPKKEVNLLMKLLVSSLKKEFKRLNENKIRLCAVGDLNTLPNSVKNELMFVIEKTKKNKQMILTLALNYGAKEEIIEAVKTISMKVKNSIISTEKVDESTIISHLYTRNLPQWIY